MSENSWDIEKIGRRRGCGKHSLVTETCPAIGERAQVSTHTQIAVKAGREEVTRILCVSKSLVSMKRMVETKKY